MSWFLTSFDGLEDPRSGNAKRYSLLDLLTIALAASVCGAESCVDFADFARDRAALFGDFLSLEGGLPSHDTFSRVFRLLDPAAFGRCFAQFLDGLGRVGPGQIAIDGKTLRASFDAAAGTSALHVVSAFATDRRMTLAQANAHGDEIAGARAVLELFDLTGALVSADALHCQVETDVLINARGGDWLFALKSNRRQLFEDVKTYFADPLAGPHLEHRTVDADHGRIETRRVRVSHDVDWLNHERISSEIRTLPGLATLAIVERTVERRGKTVNTAHAYVSSAKLSAEACATAIRNHWRIENRLHWVLDVSFNEDRQTNRKDHGPENLSILRKLALNVLQTARPDISIRRKRKRSGWSDEFARTILGQMR